MKFALAILVYTLIALILCVGVLQLIHGKPWALVAGVVAYLLAFAQLGCKTH